MSEKSRTAFGYTETDAGPIQHLKIAGVFGISWVIQAPVALIPHKRNWQGIPFPETKGNLYVFALPGGHKITQDGKIVC